MEEFLSSKCITQFEYVATSTQVATSTETCYNKAIAVAEHSFYLFIFIGVIIIVAKLIR